MATTHAPNITVNITLDPSPSQEAGFGTVMLLVPLADNSLNDDRTMTFTSYEDAVEANTDGYISDDTLEACEVAFLQRPKPAEFKLGYVDLVGGETYATGLTAVLAADDDFYGLVITPRSDAEIVLIGAAVEAASKRMLFGFQGNDASWLTAGIPAGLAAIDGNERSIAHYHDDDDEWMDVANLCNRLVYDPDVRSAPWHGHPLRGVADYGTAPTAAERLLALANNANLGLPYGGQDFVIDKGTNLNSRPADEILTADWFSTRLEERTAALVVEHSARGEKIVVDKTGQKKIIALIEALLEQGVAAGHFVSGQTEAVAETITSDDLDDRQMRFTIRAQLAVSGRLFIFNAYFSRDPIADDAE